MYFVNLRSASLVASCSPIANVNILSIEVENKNLNINWKYETSLTCGQLFANSQCPPKRRTLYQRGSLQPPLYLYFLYYLYSIQSPSCICICICIGIYVCIFLYDYICIFYNLYSLKPPSQI